MYILVSKKFTSRFCTTHILHSVVHSIFIKMITEYSGKIVNGIWNTKFPQKKIDSQVFTKETDASHLLDSTCGVVYILTSPYANFEASFKPFLRSMEPGECDTTLLSLAVMPTFVKTIVLLFPHGIKNCDCR